MGGLTKAWDQAKDLFLSITPGAGAAAGLLLGVIVISLGYLFTMEGGSSSEYLLAGRTFNPTEMGLIQAALGDAGLHGAVIEGTKIKIPAGEESKYVAAIASKGALPGDFMDFMVEAMTDLSPFANRAQQENALATAKMKTLAAIIKHMDGIENAVVMYSEDKPNGLFRTKTQTAAVNIQAKNKLASIDPIIAQGIRNMVVYSYAGIKPENVSLSVDGMPVLSPADSLDPAMGGRERYFAQQQLQQRSFEKKIHDSLAQWVPNVTVSAYVDLDPTIFERESLREFDDKKSGTVTESTSDESSSSDITPVGGRPPAQLQNGANQPLALLGTQGGTNEETTATRNERTALPAHTDRVTEKAGLLVKSVSVSVGVPSSYFVEQWKLQNPDAEREPAPADWEPLRDSQFAQWERHVLGQISTPTTADTAEVTFTTFDALPAPLMPEEELTESAMTWFAQYGGTLGMVFLGFVGLLMVRSFVKSATKTATSPAESPEDAEDSEAEAAVSPASRPARKWVASGAGAKEELAELVREDPDTAASILQGWITTPS